jgi:hypothetical protein
MKTGLVVLLMLIWSWFAFAQSNTSLCMVKTKLDLTKNCQGKKVQLIGKLATPTQITAHPDMTSPSYRFQNYLDTALGQVVLISSKNISCSEKKLEAIGILGWKNLGGAAGTRDSYQNAFLQVERFKCL